MTPLHDPASLVACGEDGRTKQQTRIKKDGVTTRRQRRPKEVKALAEKKSPILLLLFSLSPLFRLLPPQRQFLLQ